VKRKRTYQELFSPRNTRKLRKTGKFFIFSHINFCVFSSISWDRKTEKGGCAMLGKMCMNVVWCVAVLLVSGLFGNIGASAAVDYPQQACPPLAGAQGVDSYTKLAGRLEALASNPQSSPDTRDNIMYPFYNHTAFP
jgi:hypothetical protein